MAKKSKAATGGKTASHKAAAKKQVVKREPKPVGGDLSELVYTVLKQDQGMLVSELLPYVNEAIADDEKVEVDAINENGLAAILSGDKRFEVVEDTSRWRVKK